jgi:hypothetical protein
MSLSKPTSLPELSKSLLRRMGEGAEIIPVVTLKSWLVEGAPKKHKGFYDVVSWLAWIRVNKAKDGDDDTKAGLERRKLRIQCESAEYKFAVERGEHIKKSDVERDVEALVIRTKTVFLRIPHSIGNILGVDAQKKADALIVEALKELEERPLG